MNRGSAFTDRVHFLRHRREEAARLADPRRRGVTDEEWRTQGTFTPQAAQQLKDARTGETRQPGSASPLEVTGESAEKAGGPFPPATPYFPAPAALVAEPKLREFPYPEIAEAQLAAYRAAAAGEEDRPRPVFTPKTGAAPTAPMRSLPGNARVPAGPVPAAPAEVADLDLLRHVRDAMSTRWRADSFIADKKELPLFGALTKELGWQGLHVPARAAAWQRRSTARWAIREGLIADAAFSAVEAEVQSRLNAIEDRTRREFAALVGGAR